MAPSEPSILSNFLLSPASLPTVISLQQFTELFPKRLRAHPHIRVLYRELQQLREQDMDLVNGNIDQEVRQGESQKAELRKSILNTGVDGMSSNDQREIDMDVQLFGQTSTAAPSDYHSVSSLLSAMETACANIEHEISGVDKDASTLLSELNLTVGELSDLRYGKTQGKSHSINIGRTMPTIPLHPHVSSPTSLPNPLPQVLQTPTGLAILELQGTINVPSQEAEDESTTSTNETHDPSIPTFETPVGKLMFPDYSPQRTAPDDTKWMKRVYLYVGRYQRMTGEVKKLAQPLALVQRRQKETTSESDGEELEIVEIIKYKLFFKNRPEPVNDS
ncbi:Ctf8-domain-containing protein [Aspergillus pseudocaelatus]|uniref:Ctf8-domain-containing protein n=1 Tax=Aspergillus pseudocaelatus TaxID=1825620 RepID=A0ABQ6WF20_9EURO|nr:Ctf8-domain-containing protein [Aspergillus pseudocaelatus]